VKIAAWRGRVVLMWVKPIFKMRHDTSSPTN